MASRIGRGISYSAIGRVNGIRQPERPSEYAVAASDWVALGTIRRQRQRERADELRAAQAIYPPMDRDEVPELPAPTPVLNIGEFTHDSICNICMESGNRYVLLHSNTIPGAENHIMCEMCVNALYETHLPEKCPFCRVDINRRGMLISPPDN
jgi:hypothetical protein